MHPDFVGHADDPEGELEHGNDDDPAPDAEESRKQACEDTGGGHNACQYDQFLFQPPRPCQVGPKRPAATSSPARNRARTIWPSTAKR